MSVRALQLVEHAYELPFPYFCVAMLLWQATGA